MSGEVSAAKRRELERRANALWRHLKTRDRLYVGPADGGLWWTEGFVMAPVDDVVTELLARYNLTPEPMKCTAGATLRHTDLPPPPNMAKVVADATAKPRGMVEVRPLLLGGAEVQTLAGDHAAQLWTADGKTVACAVNPKLLALVSRPGHTLWMRRGAPMSPLVVRRDGALAGLVMGVRSDAIGELLAFDEANR